jgi:hypothetical protein
VWAPCRSFLDGTGPLQPVTTVTSDADDRTRLAAAVIAVIAAI